jgi:hypothetical protein
MAIINYLRKHVDGYKMVIWILPVMVAGWFKACTVFARSEAEIAGSNSTQDMDV